MLRPLASLVVLTEIRALILQPRPSMSPWGLHRFVLVPSIFLLVCLQGLMHPRPASDLLWS